MKKRLLLVMIYLMLVVSLIACVGGHDRESSDVAKSEESSEMSYDKAATNAVMEDSMTSKNSLPNDAEYDDMYFKHYGTNPFVTTEEDPLSTFAIDVDTGSYTVTRNYVDRGSLPPEEAIRVEEFINYFKSTVVPPVKETFSIQVDGGPSPFGEGYHLIRAAIKGKEIKVEDRKPANLVFVVDVSGSMDRENRLGLVKKSLNLLVSQLEGQDQIGIVVYGTEGRTILHPTSIDEKEKILNAIDQLQPEGSTNAEEGLTIAYQMAREAFTPDAINRVILCSDGVANIGNTGADSILKEIKTYAQKDITLSTFGFGMGNYNDILMEQLADNGDGNYSYIDTFSEARRIFTEELTGTLQTIAKDAKIQVDFDPTKVERYRLIGYENRDVQDEDFRNDEVDGGEIGAGHTVTALYEVKLIGDDTNGLGNIYLRFKDEESGEVQEIKQELRVGNKLSNELNFLASVTEYAEILRGSYWAKDSSLQRVLELAERTAETETQHEFVRMVKDSIAIKVS